MIDQKPDPSDSTRPHWPNPYAAAAMFPLAALFVGAIILLIFKSLGG